MCSTSTKRTRKSSRLLSKYEIPFFTCYFQKILLITYMKCDFVCRANTQLRVLSTLDATCTSHHLPHKREINGWGVCVCEFMFERLIKCLKPHVIYHKDDTCVQSHWNPVALHRATHMNSATDGETLVFAKIVLSECLRSSASTAPVFFSA